MEYDDGVYYAAARALLHGLVPYRDFTIVHPPLTSVLLLPAAGLGSAFGDAVGMGAARVEILLVECVNVWLVYRLTRVVVRGSDRARRLAPLVAATFYALAPGAVAAGHTVLLEPLTNVFVLLAMSFLLRRPMTGRAAASGGALLAAALGVKIFAAVYVFVAFTWLLCTARDRLLSAVGGFLASAGLIFVPLAAAAGVRTLWRDLIATQLTRPSDGGLSWQARTLSLFGVGRAPLVFGLSLAAACVFVSVCVAVQARRRGVAPASQLWPWVAVAALTAGAFLRSPSFFEHYAGFFAAPLAVLVGAVFALASVGRIALRVATVGAVGMLLVVAGLGSLRADERWQGAPSLTAAARQVPVHSCVYSDAVSLLIAADRFRVPDDACPSWLDGRGQNLVWSVGQQHDADFYPHGFLVDTRWQTQTLRQLEAASYLLVRSDPRRMPEWTPDVQAYASLHFRQIWVGGGRIPAQLWARIS